MLFPEARSKERVEQILSSAVLQKELASLEEARTHYLNTPVEDLPFHLFRLYFTTGDRLQYETLYFSKRGRLATFALAVLLYHRTEDIEALEDTIWSVCNEFTWMLPAHIPDQDDRYDTGFIDLFSAETGFALAEIDSLLGDVLDQKIHARILSCLEERIFQPYLTRSFWWESAEMNWAAVCAGSVGAAFLYTAPERFPLVKARIADTMQCFLSGFGSDGACLEGIGYWNYGYGYFHYYAQLLYEFTDGKEDPAAQPICKKIALFQQNVFLRKNYTVSFSDGDQRSGFLPGLSCHLKSKYGNCVFLPSAEYAEYDDPCHRFPAYLRNFFWNDLDADSFSYAAMNQSYKYYYPDAQWYLKSASILSFAAKGGNNGEPHNHNDIGSFLLTGEEGQILCDFGCGEYTKDYFNPEKRYHFLCNSSKGHSVPIINKMAQSAGKQYCAEILSQDDESFCLDLAGAYPPECGILSLKRSFLMTEDSVFVLQDTFAFTESGNEVTERFVTMKKPVLSEQKILLGIRELTWEGCDTPVLKKALLKNHSGKEESLYIIDFELTDPETFVLKVTP